MKRPVLLLLLLWAALYLPGLGQSDILSTNEANRAMAAREMLARGDWVVPTLVSEPYLNKPPLYYWQAMLCYRLFGDRESSARLPAALAALAASLVGYVYFSRRRHARAGLWSGLLIVSTPLLILQGTEAELDSGLILWVFLCELCMLEALLERPLRNTLLAYVFLALATLTKGPVAFAFFGPMLILQVVFLFHGGSVPGRRLLVGHLLGLLLCVALCLPWCYAVVHRLGWDYAWMIVKRESLERTVSASKINSDPFWFYAPRFLLGCLPWTPLLWLLRVHPARDSREKMTRQYLGLSSAAQFVLFSLFAGKETQYLMPILPPMAMVVGLALEAQQREPRSRLPRGIGLACLAALALVAVGSMAGMLAPREEARYAWRLAVVAVPLAGACLWLWKRREPRAWWAAALALLLSATAFMSFVRAPARNQLVSVKAAMASVLEHVPGREPIVVYRHGESQIYYYLHGRARAARDASQLESGNVVLYRTRAEEELRSFYLESLLTVKEKNDELKLARAWVVPAT